MWKWIILGIALALFIFVIQIRTYRNRKKIEYESKKIMDEIHKRSEQYAVASKRYADERYIRHDIQEQREYLDGSGLSAQEVVRVIMERKLAYASEKDIRCIINIDLNTYADQFADWSLQDIVSLLTNLLNNAIESCLRIENVEDRIIRLSYGQGDSGHILCIENAKPSNIHPLEQGMITSKEDSEQHGYGTRIIQEVIDEHGGDIRYYDKGNCFVSVVRLS